MAAQRSHLTYNEVVSSVTHLAPEEQLGLIQVLSSMLTKTGAASLQKHSLLELEGLGAGLWAGKNVEKHIQTERDAWN